MEKLNRDWLKNQNRHLHQSEPKANFTSPIGCTRRVPLWNQNQNVAQCGFTNVQTQPHLTHCWQSIKTSGNLQTANEELGVLETQMRFQPVWALRYLAAVTSWTEPAAPKLLSRSKKLKFVSRLILWWGLWRVTWGLEICRSKSVQNPTVGYQFQTTLH